MVFILYSKDAFNIEVDDQDHHESMDNDRLMMYKIYHYNVTWIYC